MTVYTTVGRTVDSHGGLWYKFFAGRGTVTRDIATIFLKRTVDSHGGWKYNQLSERQERFEMDYSKSAFLTSKQIERYPGT